MKVTRRFLISEVDQVVVKTKARGVHTEIIFQLRPQNGYDIVSVLQRAELFLVILNQQGMMTNIQRPNSGIRGKQSNTWFVYDLRIKVL